MWQTCYLWIARLITRWLWQTILLSMDCPACPRWLWQILLLSMDCPACHKIIMKGSRVIVDKIWKLFLKNLVLVVAIDAVTIRLEAWHL